MVSFGCFPLVARVAAYVGLSAETRAGAAIPIFRSMESKDLLEEARYLHNGDIFTKRH